MIGKAKGGRSEKSKADHQESVHAMLITRLVSFTYIRSPTVSRVKVYRLADSAACMTPQKSHRSTDLSHNPIAAAPASPRADWAIPQQGVHVARGIGQLTERIELKMKPPISIQGSRFLLKLQSQPTCMVILTQMIQIIRKTYRYSLYSLLQAAVLF